MAKSKKVSPLLLIISILLACGLVLACSSSKTATTSQTMFETLEQEYYSAIDEPFQKVIKDQSSWDDFWGKLQVNKSETSPPPQVDFTKKMVIGVGLGTKNTGGYGIQIQEITVNQDNILVDYIEMQPGTNCMVTEALTQPYQLVLVDKSDVPIEFNSQIETKEC